MDQQSEPDKPLMPQPQIPSSTPKPRRTWLIVLIVFAVFSALGAGVFLLAASALGSAITAASQQNSADNDTFVTQTIIGNDASSKVAVISLTGQIEGWGNALYGGGMVRSVTRRLRAARLDDTVKVVLLYVDSPGGSVTASDTIYHDILSLQEAGKKVVVCVDDLCASGGYYVSAPADYIICHPTGWVGSFGVIMFRFELDGLLEKLGIKFAPVKSTESKDIGSPFRPLTPEEREYFKDLLVKVHNRFVGIIAKGRKMPVEKVKKLATGKIYLAQDALNYGLVDEIGYFEDAMKKCRELAQSDNAQFIKYEKPPTFLEQVGFVGVSTQPSLPQMIQEASRYKLQAIMQGKVDTE